MNRQRHIAQLTTTRDPLRSERSDGTHNHPGHTNRACHGSPSATPNTVEQTPETTKIPTDHEDRRDLVNRSHLDS
jgi:hypothetical protein